MYAGTTRGSSCSQGLTVGESPPAQQRSLNFTVVNFPTQSPAPPEQSGNCTEQQEGTSGRSSVALVMEFGEQA
ncbi:hypothetical protein VULLAG_LOCUS6095 [Vulpes lagopus]